MRLLLCPNRNEAYGQDFLLGAIANGCYLERWKSNGCGYPPVGSTPELIVSHNLDDSADSSFIEAYGDGSTVVGHVHCQFDYFDPSQQESIEKAVRYLDVGIVPARFLADDLRHRFPSVEWQVVHNGVDTERFKPTNVRERGEFRLNHSIPSESKLVIFVGRLERAKGTQVLEALCGKIREESSLALMVQFLSNSSRTGNYESKAKELEEIGGRNVVLFPDTDTNSDRPVRYADILILPSLSEVAPLVVLEALVGGLKVIVLDCTEFYDELREDSYLAEVVSLIPMPCSFSLGGSRRELRVEERDAIDVGSDFLKKIKDTTVPDDIERRETSRRIKHAGYQTEKMIADFKSIYSREFD